tara:strand:+ start:315 stop:668 length:354 start_codon:yes stop_codon:yes gene_type:complete
MITIADTIWALDADNETKSSFVCFGEPSTEKQYLKDCKYIEGEENNETIYAETPVYTWKEISDKKKLLEDEYANNEYQRQRQPEYPSIVDQLDDIYHNGIDGWKETIKAVKDKYPKE